MNVVEKLIKRFSEDYEDEVGVIYELNDSYYIKNSNPYSTLLMKYDSNLRRTDEFALLTDESGERVRDEGKIIFNILK